jgi:nicotinate-nucleotide pyrophosphorylase (carboxylating)
MNFKKQLNRIIKNALREDVGEGDHSTISCIDPSERGRAILKVKETGIIAGIDVARQIFEYIEEDAEFAALKVDGENMMPGEVAFEVDATVHTILKAERLVLNCMQRMCGIATLTRKYVDKLTGYHTKLLDTRKTTPNFRLLEKEAVRIGGGVNHRFGLYDMIMLKDNHIDYCGGITKAIKKANKYIRKNDLKLQIEIETRTIADVEEVMRCGGVNRIMLDNFVPPQIVEALGIINKRFETEASGGINFDNLEAYAETGVDYISSGAIIHQATSMDLSLKAQLPVKSTTE